MGKSSTYVTDGSHRPKGFGSAKMGMKAPHGNV